MYTFLTSAVQNDIVNYHLSLIFSHNAHRTRTKYNHMLMEVLLLIIGVLIRNTDKETRPPFLKVAVACGWLTTVSISPPHCDRVAH